MKKSNNREHTRNGTYWQIVSHLERQLELNGLEAPDELQINTVAQQATQGNSEKPKPTCHHCKKPGHYRNHCRQLKQKKDRAPSITKTTNKNNNKIKGQTNSNSNNRISNIRNANNTKNQKKTDNLDLRTHPLRPVVELTVPQKNVTLEQKQLIDCFPGKTTGRTKPSPTEKCPKLLRWECSSCSPIFKLDTPRFHSVAACERPEICETAKLPPILKFVWQQPSEKCINQYNLENTNNDSTSQYTQETQETTVASQTWPPKGMPKHTHLIATEQPPGNQTGNEQLPFFNCSKNCHTGSQE